MAGNVQFAIVKPKAKPIPVEKASLTLVLPVVSTS